MYPNYDVGQISTRNEQRLRKLRDLEGLLFTQPLFRNKVNFIYFKEITCQLMIQMKF